MEQISVFDIFKVGVGPSSSHTMGPWVAASRFASELNAPKVDKLIVKLYGSLSKTGKGHGTDIAIMLGLQGYDPKTIDTALINEYIAEISQTKKIKFNGQFIPFDPEHSIEFLNYSLPAHPNAMSILAFMNDEVVEKTYYSIGGGFVQQEGEDNASSKQVKLPFPIEKEKDLERYINETGKMIYEIVLANELTWKSEEAVKADLLSIWNTMLDSIYRGCFKDGILPGGLNVSRRAAKLNQELLELEEPLKRNDWLSAIKVADQSFTNVTKWVSCFALAVNEENAAFGRVVTAPTNGAAGVIPAVLMYHLCFNSNKGQEDIVKFLLTAGEIGSLFKKGSTISAAMGGCQAEIGVSSSMAAAGLTACLGGTNKQIFMAAEIAMEHHMGLTCDPIGGLVQIPCIERNTMGAMKAITAAQIARSGNPDFAKVSLDTIIKTMKETAMDMSDKYKETAEGGLAVNVSVVVPEC